MSLPFVLCVCLLSVAVVQSRAVFRLNSTYVAQNRLGIILDGGSTGTKLKILSWPFRTSEDQLPDIDEIYSQKFKPNLDSLASNLGAIPAYFKAILDKAKEIIPASAYATTPIYLYMTAGARMLDGLTAKGMMDAARVELSASPFMFKRRQARVLSGEEEGAYTWITANYLQGLLDQHAKSKKLVGILEMGGGSTQIAYIPTVPVYANKYTINLLDRTYDIYSHSYLNYGQSYMNRRVNNYVLANQTYYGGVNPCMLSGDSETVDFEGSQKTVSGGSNPDKCLAILRTMVRSAPDDMCSPKPCAIGTVFQPSVKGTIFNPIAAFVYNAQGLKAIDSDGHMIPQVMHDKAMTYCAKSLSQIKTEEKTDSKRFLSARCMMGLYIPMLLTDAYGFDPNTKDIVKASNIHTKAWSLGAMLVETQYLDIATSAAGNLTPQCITIILTLGVSHYVYSHHL